MEPTTTFVLKMLASMFKNLGGGGNLQPCLKFQGAQLVVRFGTTTTLYFYS